jgi:hypothetical protein
MDIRSKARGVLVRGGLLLAALAAFAILINLSWFDEPFYPELERLRVPEPVSMENNAYPLIYGFPAANDKDPRAAGLAIVAALRDRYRQGQPIGLGDAEMADMLGGSGLDEAWQAGLRSLPCNSRVLLDCADRLLAEFGSRAPDDPRLRVLVQRYGEILQTPRFEENQEFDTTTPVPAYGLLMTVGRIRLAKRYNAESTESYLASVAEDLAFWRRMLRDGHSLIAKMVALAGIRNDLEFVSALLRDRDLGEDDILSIRRLLQPLTSEERDIGEAFVAELRVLLLSGKTVALMPDEPSRVMRLLVQRRATINEFYLKTVMPLRLLAALDAEAFYTHRGYEPLRYELRVFPPPLYNLGGKLLLKQQAETYNVQDYVSRVHDLDGRIALVLLQTEIERSPERGVQAVVDASAYRNPYTRESMDYDAAAGTIGFECVSNPGDVCAVAVGSARR